MDFKKDFENLIAKLEREASKTDNIDMVGVFKEALAFFEGLKGALSGASMEEKKEIMKVMGEMHVLLKEQARKIATKAGVTEDQLEKFSENPDNFSSGQWKALEAMKDKLSQSAHEVKGMMGPGSAPKEKKSKTQKGGWLRS